MKWFTSTSSLFKQKTASQTKELFDVLQWHCKLPFCKKFCSRYKYAVTHWDSCGALFILRVANSVLKCTSTPPLLVKRRWLPTSIVLWPRCTQCSSKTPSFPDGVQFRFHETKLVWELLRNERIIVRVIHSGTF